VKKNAQSTKGRILGRRLARELPNEALAQAAGNDSSGVWTYTLLYPSDPGARPGTTAAAVRFTPNPQGR
jgi:hypothetical protein